MGVTGLWHLVESAGRPVTLESLQGQTLAVDASILLNQAVKALTGRPGQHQSVPNPHLYVLFHRVCKLLFYRIRPIFVFDGAAPQIKKSTLARRRRRREDAAVSMEEQRLARVRGLLKQHAVQSLNAETASDNANEEVQHLQDGGKQKQGKSQVIAHPASSLQQEDDLFMLPSIPESAQEQCGGIEDDDEEDSDWVAGEVLASEFGDLSGVDTDSADFLALPLEMQHEILAEMKSARKDLYKYIKQPLPKTSGSFSSFQLKKLVNQRKISAKLEGLQKEMKSRAAGHLLSETGRDGDFLPADEVKNPGAFTVQANKIMSEVGGHYILLKTTGSKRTGWETTDEGSPSSPSSKPLDTGEARNQTGNDDDKSNAGSRSLVPGSVSTVREPQPGPSRSDKKEPIVISINPGMAPDIDLFPASMFSEAPLHHDLVGQGQGSGPHFSKSRGESTGKQQSVSLLRPARAVDSADIALSSDSGSDSDSATTPLKAGNVSGSLGKQVADQEWGEPNISVESTGSQGTQHEKSTYVKAAEISALSSKLHDKDLVANPVVSIDEDEDGDDEVIIMSSAEPAVSAERVSKSHVSCEETESYKPGFKADSHAFSALGPESTPCPGLSSSSRHKDDAMLKEIMSALEADVPEEYDSGGDDAAETDKCDGEEQREEGSGQAITDEALQRIQLSLEKETLGRDRDQRKKEAIASTVTDKMTLEAQELLKLFGVPYVVSPGEAEAQCATLEEVGLSDGTITDDSDIWLFGGACVYKNFFREKKHVTLFKLADMNDIYGLDRHKFIGLALLCGSDYTEGVKGAGPVTALEIMAEFTPQEEDLTGLRGFSEWKAAVEGKGVPREERAQRTKLRKLNLKEGFPDEHVIQAYLRPSVDGSTDLFTWSTPDLQTLRDFGRDRLGWAQSKVDDVVVPVLKKLNTGPALPVSRGPTKITDFFATVPADTQQQPLATHSADSPFALSKRTKKAVGRMKTGPAEDEPAEEEIAAGRKRKAAKIVKGTQQAKRTRSKKRKTTGWGGFSDDSLSDSELLMAVSPEATTSADSSRKDIPKVPNRGTKDAGTGGHGDEETLPKCGQGQNKVQGQKKVQGQNKVQGQRKGQPDGSEAPCDSEAGLDVVASQHFSGGFVDETDVVIPKSSRSSRRRPTPRADSDITKRLRGLGDTEESMSVSHEQPAVNVTVSNTKTFGAAPRAKRKGKQPSKEISADHNDKLSVGPVRGPSSNSSLKMGGSESLLKAARSMTAKMNKKIGVGSGAGVKGQRGKLGRAPLPRVQDRVDLSESSSSSDD